MRQDVEINGRHVVVDIEERDGQITAIVGRRKYTLTVARPENGTYLIFNGARVYEAVVWGDSDKMKVKLRGRLFGASVVDRKHRRSHSEHADEGRQQLTAPMPGKIVRVLLAAGDSVSSGQGVVVVEAMKMQNEIKSPKSGRVIEVRVIEGETVNASQVLAVVE